MSTKSRPEPVRKPCEIIELKSDCELCGEVALYRLWGVYLCRDCAPREQPHLVSLLSPPVELFPSPARHLEAV